MKIAKLKIEIYNDKNDYGNEKKAEKRDEKKAEKRELEHECLRIRSKELYFETMPQLVFQFASLSTTSLWEQGKDSSYYFYVNIKSPPGHVLSVCSLPNRH